MAKVNRGKDFERQIKSAFERVPGVSIDRLKDSMSGYMGDNTICDFIVYRKPYEFYFECKAVHGNTLNFNSQIRPNQWSGLTEKSRIEGVHAGFLVWFIDHDVTLYVPVSELSRLRARGFKSLNINQLPMDGDYRVIHATKRRVLFDYDMEPFIANFR